MPALFASVAALLALEPDIEVLGSVADGESAWREVERLNRAIGDLIGLSRPTDIRPRMTDMRRLVEDTLRLLAQDASGRGVAVRFDALPDLPLVPVDPDRMRQVILNLCLNALEAMPQGGELALDLHKEAETLRFDVRDTGTGIPPEALPHIFDPYFTTKGQGTGLGLATVHKIVEAHGGTLSVSSKPGEGTVFRLFFPLGESLNPEQTLEAQVAQHDASAPQPERT